MSKHSAAVYVEVTSCCDAFLRALYTDDVYESWIKVQEDLGLHTHREMISWLLTDVMPQLTAAGEDLMMAGELHSSAWREHVKSEFEHGSSPQASSLPISPCEALRSCDALLITLCGGAPLYQQWRRVKCHYGFTSESQFISWVLSLLPQYANAVRQQHTDKYTVTGAEYSDGLDDSNDSYEQQTQQLFMNVEDSSTFQCLICLKQFVLGDDLAFHIESRHLKLENARTELRAKPKLSTSQSKIGQTRRYTRRWEISLPRRCELCGVLLTSITDIEQHSMRSHQTYKAFGCKQCGKKFLLYRYMKDHMRRSRTCNMASVRLRCNLCPAKAATHEELGNHYASYHPDCRQHKCGRCGLAFKNLRALGVHKAKNRDCDAGDLEKEAKYLQSSECEVCNAKMGTPVELRYHYNSMHPEFKPFACKRCGLRFYHWRYIPEHMRRSRSCNGTLLTNLECPLHCKVTFKTHTAFGAHMVKVHGAPKSERRLRTPNYTCFCDMCKRGFTSSSYLLRHNKRYHSAGGQAARKQAAESHMCDTCGRVFASRASLAGHIETQHEKKMNRYRCKTCGYETYFNRWYRNHRRIAHSVAYTAVDNSEGSVQIFQCDECNKQYVEKEALRDHIQQDHINARRADYFKLRKHVCETCGKGFCNVHLLKRHLVIHSSEKPYGCPRCGKCFKRKKTLARHVKDVHEKVRKVTVQGAEAVAERKNAAVAVTVSHPAAQTFTPPPPLWVEEHCGRYFPGCQPPHHIDQAHASHAQQQEAHSSHHPTLGLNTAPAAVAHSGSDIYDAAAMQAQLTLLQVYTKPEETLAHIH